jgi:hypothetical protein
LSTVSQTKGVELVQDRGEEPGRHVAGKKPIAVLGEHCHIPDRRVYRQTDEPAKQQIVVKLFHKLAFGRTE